MITIFASPKPFTDPHINMIQRNAIQSWMALRPACEVILFGNESGTAEIAEEYNLRHVPDVECNSEGLPLVRDMFRKAETVSRFDILTYINSDIILFGDFTEAATFVKEQLSGSPFLIVGQRCDLEVSNSIDFTTTFWENDLHRSMIEYGVLHGPDGIDYFIYSRGLWSDIPPMVIGRIAYDNWLIFRARTLGVAVIDATQVIKAIHQKHEYPKNLLYQRRQSPEALNQIGLAGNNAQLFNTMDSKLILTEKGLTWPRLTISRLKRITQTGPVLHPKAKSVFQLLGMSLSLLRRLRMFYNLSKRSLHTLYAKVLYVIGGLLLAPFQFAPNETIIGLRERLKLVRRMDYGKGDIWLNIDTHHDLGRCLWSCQKEPETVKWIETYIGEGDVLYDVGANIGAYSLVAAKHTNGTARIFAFEPSFSTFANLCQNIYLNDLQDSIFPFHLSLSDSTMINRLYPSSVLSGSAEHTLDSYFRADCQKKGISFPVISYRIDDLIEQFRIEPANHMKLDVDGGELEVLKGAENLLSSCHLKTVLIEIDDNLPEDAEAISFLESKGFRLSSKHKHSMSGVSNCIFIRR